MAGSLFQTGSDFQSQHTNDCGQVSSDLYMQKIYIYIYNKYSNNLNYKMQSYTQTSLLNNVQSESSLCFVAVIPPFFPLSSSFILHHHRSPFPLCLIFIISLSLFLLLVIPLLLFHLHLLLIWYLCHHPDGLVTAQTQWSRGSRWSG